MWGLHTCSARGWHCSLRLLLESADHLVPVMLACTLDAFANPQCWRNSLNSYAECSLWAYCVQTPGQIVGLQRLPTRSMYKSQPWLQSTEVLRPRMAPM